MDAPARLIGVDWGNSNLRAFLFDRDGRVAGERGAAQGILAIKDAAFEAALAHVVGDWISGPPAVFLLCGAIGSRQGWRETPYAPCPAGEADLARALTPLPTRLGPAWIVPGVNLETPDRAETMRGEETKMLGALAAGFVGVAISPGTHSKWVTLGHGRITDLKSFMTGELFAALQAHTILGALMAPGPHDAGAFDLGARRALADPAITSLLLGARAEGLMGRIAASALSSYLSGLLIGAEVLGGLAGLAAGTAIRLVGSPTLIGLYARTLGLAGRADVALSDGDEAVAQGLWRIGRTLVSA